MSKPNKYQRHCWNCRRSGQEDDRPLCIYCGVKRVTNAIATKSMAQQMHSFPLQILQMNLMYRLPVSNTPTLPADTAERLIKFQSILQEELNEINEIETLCHMDQKPETILAAIADVLADIIVYCTSEALKYGIPLESVLDIVMQSNASKLGEDGMPIYDERGKFMKGPNYWKPEPKIEMLIAALRDDGE